MAGARPELGEPQMWPRAGRVLCRVILISKSAFQKKPTSHSTAAPSRLLADADRGTCTCTPANTHAAVSGSPEGTCHVPSPRPAAAAAAYTHLSYGRALNGVNTRPYGLQTSLIGWLAISCPAGHHSIRAASDVPFASCHTAGARLTCDHANAHLPLQRTTCCIVKIVLTATMSGR